MGSTAREKRVLLVALMRQHDWDRVRAAAAIGKSVATLNHSLRTWASRDVELARIQGLMPFAVGRRLTPQVRHAKAQELIRACEDHGWNLSAVGRQFNIHVTTVRANLRRYAPDAYEAACKAGHVHRGRRGRIRSGGHR